MISTAGRALLSAMRFLQCVFPADTKNDISNDESRLFWDAIVAP